jgi:catechol-2,3-dioxygenase
MSNNGSGTVRNIRHVGLVVEDVDKVLSFYRDRLGFEVYWDRVEQGAFVETILGMPSVRVRTIKMRSGSGCILELLRYEARIPSEKRISQAGYTHMALTVADLGSLYASLKEKKVEFLSAPQVSPDGKAKVVFCRDVEGNFLELVEDLN